MDKSEDTTTRRPQSLKEGHKNWETKTKKKSTGLVSRNAEIKAEEI
ncbi:unnamed protein product [Brassica rapa subsp. trilocularis]